MESGRSLSRKQWKDWVENNGKIKQKMVERLSGKQKKFNIKDGGEKRRIFNMKNWAQ